MVGGALEPGSGAGLMRLDGERVSEARVVLGVAGPGAIVWFDHGDGRVVPSPSLIVDLEPA